MPQQLDAHLARLAASADALGLPCDAAALRAAVIAHCADANSAHRLKITLQHDGTPQLELAPLDAIAGDVFVLEHPTPLPDRDPLRRHKTTHCAHLDRIWQAAVANGAFDALLYNESGELLEGARSSVFLRIDGAWYTPPLALDILPGIARARILAEPALIGATHIAEGRLRRGDVARAEKILLVNSLRGILTAHRIA